MGNVNGLECYINGACPFARRKKGRHYCIKSEGDCEYQILSNQSSIEEDLKERAKETLLRLHNIGGCDAQDEYSKGWDEAITEAIKEVERVTGVSIEEALD